MFISADLGGSLNRVSRRLAERAKKAGPSKRRECRRFLKRHGYRLATEHGDTIAVTSNLFW